MECINTRIRWLLIGTCLGFMVTLAPIVVAAQPSTSVDGIAEPSFETFGALPWQEPPGAEPWLVDDVTDGDTIRVIELDDEGKPNPWWEPVRMIGVDAPERDGPRTDEECYGPEASAFLAELLPEGTTVYLQVDDDETDDDQEFNNDELEVDDFDRLLVHVFIRADGTDDYYLVTEILALGGYVDVKDYGDNSYFADALQDAEDIARNENRGLWGACRM
ncbi:MAG: thermonuclease family protein [Chloroflexota bacterium]|nr:thermonuclease family protein [Chloroflexota bacterium]